MKETAKGTLPFIASDIVRTGRILMLVLGLAGGGLWRVPQLTLKDTRLICSYALYLLQFGLPMGIYCPAKGLPYDSYAVHLVKDGGQQYTSAYRALNLQALVPSLQTATASTDGSATLTQSLAIMEYLEEACPQAPALLPADLVGRARVRALAQVVACEIHPLNNLRVLRYLTQEMGLSSQQKMRGMPTGSPWAWALEEMPAISSATGHGYGDSPSLGRLLPGAASVQRPALWLPHPELSHH